MLALTRKVGESILIGDDIRVIIYKIDGRYVTVAIDAPKEVLIIRAELLPAPTNQKDER